MRQFSAALLSRAFGPLIALFSSPCGRHSCTGGRRRRSTRVRRYAPVPAQVSTPVEATTPPARNARTPERPRLPAVSSSAPVPAARLAPPSERFPAEDIALVRPYYEARERLRLRAPENPVPAPRAPEPRTAESRNTEPRNTETETEEVQRGLDRAKAQAKVMLQQWRNDPGGDLLGEPAPRFGVVRARPTPPRYAEWDELTSATRAWLDQQERRTQQPPQPPQTRQPQQRHHRQAVPA